MEQQLAWALVVLDGVEAQIRDVVEEAGQAGLVAGALLDLQAVVAERRRLGDLRGHAWGRDRNDDAVRRAVLQTRACADMLGSDAPTGTLVTAVRAMVEAWRAAAGPAPAGLPPDWPEPGLPWEPGSVNRSAPSPAVGTRGGGNPSPQFLGPWDEPDEPDDRGDGERPRSR